MNELQYKKIESIAKDVRDSVSKEAEKSKRSSSLRGYCAIASAKLHQSLTDAGIDAELHLHNGAHVYVVVDDHVVDVTATQFHEFKYTPIVIIHTKVAQQYYYYETTKVFKSAASLREHQVKTKWPRTQIVKLPKVITNNC